MPTSSFRDLSILVHMTNVECDGIESTVFDCSSDTISNNILDRVNVAGAICKNSTVATTARPTPTTGPAIAGALSGISEIIPLAAFVGILAIIMIIIGGIVIVL